ncbi:MAG: hypothetical protein HY788_22235 [Deltaproteobacteria bacterium]|nr:hypothetical protein [Deltaproteobacteria bacterium]
MLDWYGYSWEGYRRVRKGVMKRISRHMQELESRSVKEYVSLLDVQPAQKARSERLMSVTISRFLRDRSMWNALEREILPDQLLTAGSCMKIWCAGCACGEEVYTFLIVWTRLEERCGPLPEFELWATDMNVEALTKARTGIYPRSSLRELPDEWRSRYFSASDGGKRFAVSESLKHGIRWEVHSLDRENPPASGFQLILLRNGILTYLSGARRNDAFLKVFQSLAAGGVLAVGAHEQLPSCICGQMAKTSHPLLHRKRPLEGENG